MGISLFSESVVSKALSGEDNKLTAKLLLYIIVEHKVDYKDFIKEDKTEYYKIVEEERNYLKETIQYLRKLALKEPESRLSKIVLAL